MHSCVSKENVIKQKKNLWNLSKFIFDYPVWEIEAGNEEIYSAVELYHAYEFVLNGTQGEKKDAEKDQQG